VIECATKIVDCVPDEQPIAISDLWELLGIEDDLLGVGVVSTPNDDASWFAVRGLVDLGFKRLYMALRTVDLAPYPVGETRHG
jgi:hypothetical protein